LHALQQTSRVVRARQVQNAGTIGGNLCNASPAADGVPALLVLGAEVALLSEHGLLRLGLGAFLIGPRQTALRLGEILSALIIPDTALRGRSHFVKLGARTHLVISIAMVASRLSVDAGRIVDAAIAVRSCGPVAVSLPLVEAALKGVPLVNEVERVCAADEHAALAPIDGVRAKAAFRREAAIELVRRKVAKVLA